MDRQRDQYHRPPTRLPLRISCDDCAMQCTSHCDDCVVSFVVRSDDAGVPDASLELSDDQAAAVSRLAGAGLVPGLRFELAG